MLAIAERSEANKLEVQLLYAIYEFGNWRIFLIQKV